MPAPSSRIRHSAFICAGSAVTRLLSTYGFIAATTACAAASASARVAPPVST
jgi:hypothetical protein